MALINCDECGNQVSDKADACPKCGNPIVRQFSPSTSSHAARPPAPPIHSSTIDGKSTTELYEAFLGEKSRAYYLTKFEQFDQQGPGLKASWNWAALLVNGPWLLYRKMYGWFFAFWFIAIVSTIVEKMKAPGLSAVVIGVPWIAFTIYANSLYHNSVKKKIAVAQLTVKDEPRLLELLRRKGGVHTSVVWVCVAIPLAGIMAAIFIPAFQNYSERAARSAASAVATTPVAPTTDKFGGTLVEVPSVAAPASATPSTIDVYSKYGLTPPTPAPPSSRSQSNRQSPESPPKVDKQVRVNGFWVDPPETPRCVYKSVMTDDDYRACGAEPPKSR